ncbi:MAG: glycosyltransferase family 4 protein [Xenococcaceae cyanobacterium]
MKILMLSSTFPYPPSRGGTQVRTFNLLKHLSKCHAVTLVTQRSEDIGDAEINSLSQYVAELVVFPRPPKTTEGIVGKIKRFGQFWQQGTPPNVLSTYSLEIQQWIERQVASAEFDVITCEHSINEIYVQPQWQAKLPTILNIHSSVYRTCQNQLATGTSENKLRDRLYLPLLRRYEQNFCQKFSHIVVTTEEDTQQVLKFNPPGKVWVIPNGVDLEIFSDRPVDPGGQNIIFFGGMDYIANIDAACFFSTEVLPKLQQRHPGTTLSIVGSNPTPKVLALAKLPGIKVTGRVPSIAEYLHQAVVCVIPMRTGFGIKNKTLEAMAAGCPVVGSDRGLEGIEVDSDRVPLRALRANTVDEYVEAISNLFNDIELRAKLSHNGREMIEQEYTWSSLAQLYEQVIKAD